MKGNVLSYVENYDDSNSKLLMYHGMADDNVVFRHTVKLIDALQKMGRHNYRLEAYPGEKHGFRATTSRVHRDRQILEFFLDTLDLPEDG